jgi:hypothetical protein
LHELFSVQLESKLLLMPTAVDRDDDGVRRRSCMNYFSEEAVAADDDIVAPHKLFFLRLESKLLTAAGRHDDVAGVLPAVGAA